MIALAILGALAVAPAPVRAQPADPAPAPAPTPSPAPGAAEYERGQVAYDLGRYEDAIVAWEQAYALSKHTLLLFNLGQAARLAGDCRRAVGFYRAFLRAAPDAPQAEDAEAFVAQLGTCPEQAEPAAGPGETPPTPSEPEPGPGTGPAAGGDRMTRLVAPTLLATGAVSLAAGVFLGRRAEAKAREVSELCAVRCEWSEVEAREAAGRQAQTLQWVAYGVGAAAVAGAVTTYYLGRRRAHARASLALQPHRGGGVLALEATW